MRLNEHNAATSVYLQQISNHIVVGQGYSQLRKHLFRELHQLNNGEMVSDDRLSESIVSHLATSLNRTVNFHKSSQTFRILQIIEDLLTYVEDVMSPAMHTEQFVSTLVHTANPKIITFDSKMDAECRSHALGIFMFWFDRYGREENDNYQLFIKGYRQLKNKNLLFPTTITIKTNDFYKKELQKEKNAPVQAETNDSKTNRIILEDIQAFTIKTQSIFKENFKTIATTQYVRLIKHKSKTLFEFTSKPNDFKQKEKALVKDLYKRLRVILKELDKYKETSLQTKKSEETEKHFVEAKMTPKKASQIQSPTVQKTQITSQNKIIAEVKKQVKTPIKKSENMDLLDIAQVQKKPISTKKENQNVTPTKPQKVIEVDLLNDDDQQFVEGIVVDPSENPQQSKQAVALFQVFSTPKKQIHEEEGVLLAKQDSSHSQQLSPGFDNQKMSKNQYSFIPNDLNLTPTSSIEDDQDKVKDKPKFNFFGLLNPNKDNNPSPQTFEDQPYHYDAAHKKGKKCSQQTPKKKEQTIAQSLKNYEIKDVVNSPNYKPVVAVNYDVYAKFVPISPQKQDQQSKFELSPKKAGDKDLQQVEFSSPKSGQKIKQVAQ